MNLNTIISKISSAILILCLTLSAYFLFNAYSYNIYINEFYDYFNKKEFKKANQHLNYNENFNLYKKIFLKKDLDKFSDNIVNELDNNLKNKSITELDAAQTLYELTLYSNTDSINTLKNSLSLIIKSKENYTKANELIADNTLESYTDAIDCLNKICPYSDEYTKSLSLKMQASSSIEDLVLSKSNLYADKNDYSKALALLDDYEEYLIENDNIDTIRKSYSESQNNSYLDKNKDKEQTVAASTFLSNISISNMNTLGISSPTKYLIYVNLKEQRTYVFSGSMNKWKLEKFMPCSSGIKGYETPTGVFDITDRGDWFFSDKYNDGAKYWLQFKGNYLFHSLPFKEDKKTITDYTLGKASSHGCIRLSLEDSKWLYDNITDKTKVIIN